MAAKSHLNNCKYEYSLIRMVYVIEIILVVREIQISCKSSLNEFEVNVNKKSKQNYVMVENLLVWYNL